MQAASNTINLGSSKTDTGVFPVGDVLHVVVPRIVVELGALVVVVFPKRAILYLLALIIE